MLGQSGAWTCQIDAPKIDAAGTAKWSVMAGAMERRSGPHDPAWYRDGVPPPDAAAVEAELKALAANRWVARPTPKLPRPNMDWGSAVFAPELDLILRFSGGHSAYSGTAPQVYDVKTDRYSIPFAPEYPLEYVYSNDQVRGEWSFKKNPWMTGHTYKSTGYDPHLQSLVFAPHDFTYFFDPKSSRWSRGPERNPYQPSFYLVSGVRDAMRSGASWCGANHRQGERPELWQLDAAVLATWKPLPLKGDMPQTSADHHGMAYDSKRDRLLLFSDLGKHKGDVLAYDFKTGTTRWLEAAGPGRSSRAVAARAIYFPDADAGAESGRTILRRRPMANGFGVLVLIARRTPGSALSCRVPIRSARERSTTRWG